MLVAEARNIIYLEYYLNINLISVVLSISQFLDIFSMPKQKACQLHIDEYKANAKNRGRICYFYNIP